MSSPVPASPVVSTQWLADHLGSDNLVILDATVFALEPSDDGPRYRSGRERYLSTGHVPGALFADLLQEFSDPTDEVNFSKPSAELFEAAAASVGIDNDTTVVVYDALIGQWAARVWWLFRAFGYDDVAVLDGGLTKWNSEARPFENGVVAPRAVPPFTATARPELWVDQSFVKSIVAGETDAALICSQEPGALTGTGAGTGTGGERARVAHIPGSISLPAATLVDPGTNVFLRGDALVAALAPAAEVSAHLISYCGDGTAAALALALTRAGNDHVSIYDGSLSEWTADVATPMSAIGA
jgi:thiosulfate/3-mercaptopyruvate sulfurtransferase